MAKTLYWYAGDGAVVGYLGSDGRWFFKESGEPLGYRDGKWIFSPTGTTIGYLDDAEKWIYNERGEQLGYLA